MKSKTKIVFSYTIACIAFIFTVGCESNFKGVQKINFSEFSPSGEADSITFKYTDSGKIKAILKGKKMLDYATVEYPFTEFPKGVEVTLYDGKGKRTFVTANHAMQFKGTEIIDLAGDVKIRTEDNQLLETEQLYYDQKNSWFFTEKKYKFTAPKGVSYGEGVDFDKDFKVMNTQKFSGQMDQSEE
ncbi:LPS export ABC transporter periplasmic protein LptC [Flavobacterium sp. PLA-1-15]|uniref:LPS export ABC transporter periplasmic protein LptC n=1 Tax=Flavobacterium sp. PLA-1-15 TaxID=3380533 RepID=UPI003B78B624